MVFDGYKVSVGDGPRDRWRGFVMPRLDFIPDFEFNMVRVAWLAIFALFLYWGVALKRAEVPVAMDGKATASATKAH